MIVLPQEIRDKNVCQRYPKTENTHDSELFHSLKIIIRLLKTPSSTSFVCT